MHMLLLKTLNIWQAEHELLCSWYTGMIEFSSKALGWS